MQYWTVFVTKPGGDKNFCNKWTRAVATKPPVQREPDIILRDKLARSWR